MAAAPPQKPSKGNGSDKPEGNPWKIATIGMSITLIAAIVGAAWAVRQWMAYSASVVQLAIEAESGPFEMPPFVTTDPDERFFTSSAYKKYFHLTIVNSGEVEADKVAIIIAGRGLLSIVDAKGQKNTVFNDRYEFGSLPIGDKVEVSVWVASFSHSEQITVTHKNGKQAVPLISTERNVPAVLTFVFVLFVVAPVLSIAGFIYQFVDRKKTFEELDARIQAIVEQRNKPG